MFHGERLRSIEGVSVSDYLSAVETLVNVVFNFEPRVPTTVMIATEIPAAINPYSMAVAPDSSRMKRRKSIFMCTTPSNLSAPICTCVQIARSLADKTLRFN
jgi:hypothetical protein